MAVTVGTVTTGQGGGTSFGSVVADAGSNTALYVVMTHYFSAANISGPQYGGVAMTEVAVQDNTSDCAVHIWRLLSPSSGSASVTFTNGSGRPWICAALSLAGVHQTTPEGTAVGNSASAAAASNDVTAATGDLVLDGLAIQDVSQTTSAKTVGAGQTERVNDVRVYNAGADDFEGAASTEAGAASVTMSWTWTGSNQYAHIAIPILAASGGGGGGGGAASMLLMGVG
jgi:hypothetical protein